MAPKTYIGPCGPAVCAIVRVYVIFMCVSVCVCPIMFCVCVCVFDTDPDVHFRRLVVVGLIIRVNDSHRNVRGMRDAEIRLSCMCACIGILFIAPLLRRSPTLRPLLTTIISTNQEYSITLAITATSNIVNYYMHYCCTTSTITITTPTYYTTTSTTITIIEIQFLPPW